MKKLKRLYLSLYIILIGLNEAVAGGIGPCGGPCGPRPHDGGVSVPEMDASIAVVGLGLAVGLAVLISEYHRR